jgi:hypothetical protein
MHPVRAFFACLALAGMVLGMCLCVPCEAAGRRVAARAAKGAPPSERVTAAEVDRRIKAALPTGIEPAPLTNDEDFLRRVSLDLAGTIPSPKDVTLFGLDPDPGKRARLIDRLLQSDGYAKIWSSYWAEVIFGPATEQRARVMQGTFEEWMQAQLKANTPWDRITTDLLTATGSIEEEGATALIFAHNGQPQELAAETSRIFLGIQIQCANCHDHPTDAWKRQQFHELAAFFPRIQVRRDPDGGIRSFTIASADPTGNFRGGGGGGDFDPARIFQFLDRNRDGKVTKEEGEQGRFPFARLLEQADKNKDGALSAAEFKDMPRPPANPGRGSPEYYMPDLDDPSSRGTLVEPVFFVDGASLDRGAKDLERRQELAEHIASPDNPWFAKALVNRIWAEMLGEGFYMPIDDMGPQREARVPAALDALADAFAANHYDIQWLFRTIANTEAYQRQIRAKTPGVESPAFASAMPTRLRADQVYNAVTSVLGVSELSLAGGGRGPGGPFGRGGARAAFAQMFGYDPSTPQEDILGTIPQALFLMNYPQLNALIRGDGDTKLGRILREYGDDRDALSELYLLVLAREPSRQEQQINLAYLEDVGNRREAFEDVMWSLLNSSEFLSKR